eukprot:TRINITY_DN1160_c0_g2_i1.p1 TRINITY_DN1160_c0_g2~~TRINITY_DN1160_c0_g2_i1.p1  ORF type:complete len:347 (+),score=52.11 TRINITY_DN1160_c0_g2_i1:685-1725(+)
MLSGWIRFFGAFRGKFVALAIGSVLGAMGQPFLDATPTVLVAHWFGDNERTTAVSIFCVFGWNGATALCLWLIPQLVVDFDSLYNFLLATAVICTVIGLMSFFLLKEKPPTAPSFSASAEHHRPPFVHSFVRILTDPGFMLLAVSWGCTLGILQFFFLSAGVLWQPTFTQEQTGKIVAVAGLVGMASALVTARVVDTYKIYKQALLFGSGGTALSLFIVSFLHDQDFIWGVGVMSGLYGWFALSTYPIALEYGCELTFPISEQFSASVITIIACLWTIVFAYLMEYLTEELSHQAALIALSIFMVCATVATHFIPKEYKRQAFENKEKSITKTSKTASNIPIPKYT